MYLSKIILLLSHLFSVPTASNPLLYSSQFLKRGYPEDVQMQRNMPGIVSYGSVFIGSMNNGMQITEHRPGPEKCCNEFSKGMNSKEGFQEPQNASGPFQGLDNPNLDVAPPHSGSLATSGLSSMEVFLAQAMEIAKAKEKENAGHFAFTTDINEGGGKGKPINAVKLPNRPKTTVPAGVQSEAISFVISEPFQTSGKTPPDPNKGKTLAIHSHGGQMEIENSEYKVLPMMSRPGVQENTLFNQLTQQIIIPCQLKDLSEASTRQTETPTVISTSDYTTKPMSTTTGYVSYSTTTTPVPTTTGNVYASTTNGHVTEPAISEDHQTTTTISTSTKEPRNLRSAVTSKSFKLTKTKPLFYNTQV